jgi:hypothetical protein
MMLAQSLPIEARQRPMIPSLASLNDFTVSEGEWFDAGIVLSSPNISLYCLDDATRRAIFVELPPDVNLASAPFVYQMQYDQAQRLIAMPYDTFRELAHTLPEVRQLILIFSVPRSGTTLMSHVLNQVESVVSLSEPDVASQFFQMRVLDGSRDAELSELLACTVRLLFKPGGSKTPTTCAIKFRSETTAAMDLYHMTFPQAKLIFLYRDAIGVMASFYRLFQTAGLPETFTVDEYNALFGALARYDFTQMAQDLLPGVTDLSHIQQLALNWLLSTQRYLEQSAHQFPVLAVRYADLNGRREQTLAAIFAYCGLPVDQVSQTLGAFAGDSQAGTMLAREKPTEGNAIRFTDAQISEIKGILSRHPVINVPDFMLPGTLRV